MGEITEPRDKRYQKSCRSPKRNIYEYCQISNLGRVGLIQHNYNYERCDRTTNPIEEEEDCLNNISLSITVTANLFTDEHPHCEQS